MIGGILFFNTSISYQKVKHGGCLVAKFSSELYLILFKFWFSRILLKKSKPKLLLKEIDNIGLEFFKFNQFSFDSLYFSSMYYYIMSDI